MRHIYWKSILFLPKAYFSKIFCFPSIFRFLRRMKKNIRRFNFAQRNAEKFFFFSFIFVDFQVSRYFPSPSLHLLVLDCQKNCNFIFIIFENQTKHFRAFKKCSFVFRWMHRIRLSKLLRRFVFSFLLFLKSKTKK